MKAGGDANGVISNRSCIRGEKVLEKKTKTIAAHKRDISVTGGDRVALQCHP